MIFGINTTSDISILSLITYNNFEIPLVEFMPIITTNDAITYTYYLCSNEICRTLNLNSLSNVVDLRSSRSLFHSAVDAYLSECKP